MNSVIPLFGFLNAYGGTSSRSQMQIYYVVTFHLKLAYLHRVGVTFVMCIHTILIDNSFVGHILVKKIQIQLQVSRFFIGHAANKPAVTVSLFAYNSDVFAYDAMRN